MLRKLALWSSYGLAALLPLTVYWPVGPPVSASVMPLYVTPVIYLADLPILVILAGGLFALKNRPARTRALLGGLMAGILLLAVIGLPWALSPALAAYSLLRWTLAAGLFFALAFLDLPLERLIQIYLVSLCLHVLVGLGQFLLSSPLGLPGELALPLSNPRAAVIYTTGRTWLRAYGLTFHPNVLGGFLTSGLILGLPLLKRPAWRAVWLWLGLGLILTFSRSAWLAAVMGVSLAGLILSMKFPGLRRGLFITLSSALIVGVIFGVLLAKPLMSRALLTGSQSENATLSARAQLIQVALMEIGQHPLKGVGAGNFPLAQSAYSTYDPLHYVHNVPLLLAAEVNVLGGLLWLGLWLLPVFVFPVEHVKNHWLVALAAAWFALGIIALWDSYPWALECGRLLSVTLLAFTARLLDGEGA